MTDETEMKSGQWVVHILGPDDVIDQPDEVTALREANSINKMAAEVFQPNDPIIVAIAKDVDTEEV